MWRWWRKRRRARILAEPFPEDWLRRIERDVALWHAVPEEQRQRLADDLRLFIAERYWEPCGGLELSESMCAVIAAQACVLTLGRSVDAFAHVRSILVYPNRYLAPDTWEDEAGVITEEVDERDGEAWEWGTVVLSWQEVLRDSRSLNGRNLVLHELAHQLDLLEAIDRPTVGAGEQQEQQQDRWEKVFLDAYEAFCDRVDRGKRVKGLDEYGAEDESEFFAVATESFFERGAFFKEHQPQLYTVLSDYYNQDPASWQLPQRPPTNGSESGRRRRRARREEERKRRKHRVSRRGSS